MVHQREGYKVIIKEPAKSRIERGECPACGKPKSKWTRRTDWRCCSWKCTEKFNKSLIIYGWTDIRAKAITRDNATCVKCGIHSHGVNLTVDHIIPIALGGDEWNMKNLQTLCEECHKKKTRKDIKKIAALRKVEIMQRNGQRQL